MYSLKSYGYANIHPLVKIFEIDFLKIYDGFSGVWKCGDAVSAEYDVDVDTNWWRLELTVSPRLRSVFTPVRTVKHLNTEHNIDKTVYFL